MTRFSTFQAKTWLPDTAFCDGVIDDWLTSVVSTWATAWLGIKNSAKIDLKFVSSPPTEPILTSISTESVQVLIPEQCRLVLIEHLIDESVRDKSLSVSDNVLLNGLIDGSLSELVQELLLEEEKAGYYNTSEHGIRTYQISCNGRPVFYLGMTLDLCARQRSSFVSKSVLSDLPKGLFEKACSDEIVKLEADIGAVGLKLEELQSLKIGDVLELTRGLDESFPLLVNARSCKLIQARYVLTKDHLSGSENPGVIFETPL